MNGAEQNNVVHKGLAHEGEYQVEEGQYLNRNRSYNFKPNNNLPTHYTPALRNHENISYGGGMQKVQDQPRTINKTILHLYSKDNIKVIKDHTIKDRKDLNHLRNGC